MGGAPDSSLSPGFGGFLVFFVLALALWLLMRSMGGVLRRMQYRQEAEQPRQDHLADQPGGDEVAGRPVGGRPGRDETGRVGRVEEFPDR